MSESTPLKVVKSEPASSPIPDDAKDIEALWLDPSLGDGLTETNWQDIPVGKPKSFFRVHPDPAWRRRGEVYVHKIEGQIETSYYMIAPEMRGQLIEARPCCIVTCIDREGAPRLWPIMFPRDGEKDNSAWSTARSAARAAIDRWLRLVWHKRSYLIRDALPGYAPDDPNWKRVPPFNELIRLGLGQHGIIRDDEHPICRELMGAPGKQSPAMIFDYRDLPYREIWVTDGEFYPGAGLAHGGVEGDPLTPLCLVALELRSGRLIRLWQNELGPFPPYRLDNEALIVSYVAAAEFGFHIAKGWGEPAAAIDAYVEFRHLVNDGAVKSEDREKGFFSLAGALRYFCEDEIDVTHKKDMRDRILQGPPFSAEEARDIIDYCEDDVRALARLLPHLIPTIRPPLEHALFRAKFQWTIAKIQHRGVPIDGTALGRLRHRWQDIRLGLVEELDPPFRCFEIVNGHAHWRKAKFVELVHRHKMNWPTLESGALDETDQTFREMCGKYPWLEPLRELRYSLAKLRLNDLAVGNDNRNRAQLWAYGTKTGRNAPNASQFVFGPAKWLRFLISTTSGRALVHRDYCQQEVRIVAILSGDIALLEACESGDVYLGIAHQLGFLPDHLNDTEREAVRNLFKTVVLGILYGLGPWSLAMRTGISLFEAVEILARLRARFHRFEAWAANVQDHAGLDLELSTPFGWRMQCPPNINSRTARNFPVQSSGSEILHVACVLAERRGIAVVAPVHDAIMAEGPVDQIDDIAAALDQVMGDAAAIVLRGYRLPTDEKIIRPGERYFEKRGKEMWTTVTHLLAKLDQREIA